MTDGGGRRGDAPRHVVVGDLDQVEATLATAFFDDPLVGWLYPDVHAREEQAHAFFRVALEAGRPKGHTYTLDGYAAATIWAPPDVELFDEKTGGRLLTLLAEQLGERAGPVGEGLLRIDAAHPHDVPHFYLFAIGTRPEHQGRGLGGVLLRDVLDRCDRQRMPAYLESSCLRNVPFYERHGFRVLEEIELSETFTARPMWRDPVA